MLACRNSRLSWAVRRCWATFLQLNYGNPVLREAMLAQLRRVTARCDGVRCDMATLVLPDVFQRTWGIPMEPFWTRATKTIKEGYKSKKANESGN